MITIIAIIFGALLFIPFLMSLLSVQKSSKASLDVKSDNVRDPRYFAKSFRTMIENGIDRQTQTIQMSREETFIFAEQVDIGVCESIVVAEHPFHPRGVTCFCKEVYAESSAIIEASTTLRTLACLEELEIGRDCEIIRWVDSEKQMTVLPGCNLGISASSPDCLLIAPECVFRRLYAPKVIIGHTVEEKSFPIVDTHISSERWIDVEAIDSGDLIDKTIVTGYSLEIGENAVIHGSIKSNRHIYIHKNVRITGNVVADGTIMIEEGVWILGNVFSQDSIIIGPESVVGMNRKIKSLIARKTIILSETSRVYGYVGSEIESKTISKSQFRKELSKQAWSTKMDLIAVEIAEEEADEGTTRTGKASQSTKSKSSDSLFDDLDEDNEFGLFDDTVDQTAKKQSDYTSSSASSVSSMISDTDSSDDDDILFDDDHSSYSAPTQRTKKRRRKSGANTSIVDSDDDASSIFDD